MNNKVPLRYISRADLFALMESMKSCEISFEAWQEGLSTIVRSMEMLVPVDCRDNDWVPEFNSWYGIETDWFGTPYYALGLEEKRLFVPSTIDTLLKCIHLIDAKSGTKNYISIVGDFPLTPLNFELVLSSDKVLCILIDNGVDKSVPADPEEKLEIDLWKKLFADLISDLDVKK